MTHPLTDEICADISPKRPFGRVLGEVRYCNDMRAGADWQLERDAEHFAEYLTIVLGEDPEVAELRAERFKKAMRPQQQEDN